MMDGAPTSDMGVNTRSDLLGVRTGTVVGRPAFWG